MLKCELNKKSGDIRIECAGTTVEICSDICMLMMELYNKFEETNEDNAEFFKTSMMQAVADQIPFQKIDEDGIKWIEKKDNEAKQENEERKADIAKRFATELTDILFNMDAGELDEIIESLEQALNGGDK